jgi:hypothetical protein
MKNKFLLGTTVLSLGLILGACGSSDVNTGGSGNSTEKKQEQKADTNTKQDSAKRVDASSQTSEALGMKVALGEIKIADDKISVGMNIQNTTDKVLHFYPDQGQMVVGDMQLDANMFMTSGKIGGDVQGGVKQDGVIEFLAPDGKKIDVTTVKEVKLIFGDVTTGDYMDNKPVEFVVPVQ